MEKYVESITNYLHKELVKAAISYFRVGLDSFHRANKIGAVSQPALGNLCVAVELLLKALIAKSSPALLFKGLPLEVQALFTCAQSLPKDFNWRPYDIDLRSFKYETKDLNECVALFYILLPDCKQELYAYMQLLARFRNVSIHATLPAFQGFEIQRVAFLALRLLNILQSKKTLSKYDYVKTRDDEKFLSAYKLERVDRVKKQIDDAKERSRHLSSKDSLLISVDGWNEYVTQCPICQSDSMLYGYTDIHVVGSEEDPDVCLDFFADQFLCEECGLHLNDSEEIKLAGIDIFYDRSSELDKWYRQHGDEEY